MTDVRLQPDVELVVSIDDATPFGSPIGARPEQTVREALGPIVRLVERGGPDAVSRRSRAALVEAAGQEAFRAIAAPSGGAWDVREAFRFPDPLLARHGALDLVRAGTSLRIGVEPGRWDRLHAALARPDISSPLGKVLWEHDLVDDGESETDRMDADLTFVGHNTVVVRGPRASVMVDPYFRPAEARWPTGYQPLGPGQLGDVDAVLITHSHPDHFDPASLLRIDPDTRVVVPVLERETVLAVDLVRRLWELGFADVVALGWWQSITVGDLEITALPFYGEQPTDGPVLHPEIRNAGNTYVVRTPGWSAAFLADSGRDHLGDVRGVADRWHAEHGPVDVVFGGYRGWFSYPAALVTSSVARYLPFVPPEQWQVRQQLMNGPSELIDAAERFGARWVVPYADGGAPWFWEIGLGPRLDGDPRESPSFDPFPERVVEAAASRMVMGGGFPMTGSVDVVVLRPGDGVTGLPGAMTTVRLDGHAWPW